MSVPATNVPSTAIDQMIWMQGDAKRKKVPLEISLKIVNQYVDLTPEFRKAEKEGPWKWTIFAYAYKTLSLGLLFKDVIREGDGVLKVLKFFLPIFKTIARKIMPLKLQLSSIAEQLKWLGL